MAGQDKSVWEDKYSTGQDLNLYPWDAVVSWVYRNSDRKNRDQTRILEVGCGAGNNLWFAAREGFQVFGIDLSESAIEFAKKRFVHDGLKGDFRTGSILELPYPDGQFDMVIDRAAITCLGKEEAEKCFAEIKRVLVPGGKFFFNPYSDMHSSLASGKLGSDSLVEGITQGGVLGAGAIRFYSYREILAAFADGWQFESMKFINQVEMIKPEHENAAEWRVCVRKL